MNPKTKRMVIEKMTLERVVDDTFVDFLQEQELETKPSRAIRSFDSNCTKKKNKYEKLRNPKYFDDYDD